MAKSVNSSDDVVAAAVASEVERFLQLIKGHEKLLRAIGEL